MATFESISAAANSAAGSSNPASCTMSASAVAGSYAIVAVCTATGVGLSPSLPVTSGSGNRWVFIANLPWTVNQGQIAIFGKFVESADINATVSVPLGGGAHWDIAVVTYSGCDGVDQIAVRNNTSSTTVAFPAIRPRFDNATVVDFVGTNNTTSAASIATASTSYNKRYDDSSTATSWKELYIQDRTLATVQGTAETPSSVTNAVACTQGIISVTLLDTGQRVSTPPAPVVPLTWFRLHHQQVAPAGSATTSVNGTATLTGAGVVADTSNAQSVTASLAAVGAVTGLVTESAAATITGTAALTSPAVQRSTATLTSAAVLTDAVTEAATVAASGAGSLTSPVVQGATAVLAGAGAVSSPVTQRAVAALTGAAAVTGNVTQRATGTVAAAGVLTATVAQTINGAASLTGASTVIATTAVGSTVTPAAAGALTASATVQALGVASLAGTAAVSAAATQRAGVTAAATGAVASVVTQRSQSSPTASSSVTASAQVIVNGTADLSAVPAVTAGVVQGATCPVTATTTLVGVAAATLNAAATVAAQAVLIAVGTPRFTYPTTGRTDPTGGRTAPAFAGFTDPQ